jgi:hypothetical protein
VFDLQRCLSPHTPLKRNPEQLLRFHRNQRESQVLENWLVVNGGVKVIDLEHVPNQRFIRVGGGDGRPSGFPAQPGDGGRPSP